MVRQSDIYGLLPLSASAFHILVALAEGERHGFSISREVEAATDGIVRLAPGTLYRLLKQMALDGWIEETERDEDDLRTRYYRLAPFGRRIAQAEALRLQSLLDLARSRRLLPARYGV